MGSAGYSQWPGWFWVPPTAPSLRETPGRESGSSAWSEGMKVHPCANCPHHSHDAELILFSDWNYGRARTDRTMDTQKEGGQAGGQTQDQLWDIPGQVSGEMGQVGQLVPACPTFHAQNAPVQHQTLPIPWQKAPCAQCCPIPSPLSTTAPKSLGTPCGLPNLGLCF